ncbi:MAG TPA: ABC transporter permease [Treponemataceae bacterium]|nr:ABC transporter permease [Treponemataceae bacterium]HPS43502.1 ABC transporter permease [Treponemataceae bacterium]
MNSKPGFNIYGHFLSRLSKKKPTSEPARHARRAFQNLNHRSLSNTMLTLAIAFLFLPLAVTVVYSFNDAKSMVWTGFSLRWYDKLVFGSEKLWTSFGNSAIIALSAGAVSTALGTLAAIGVNWYRFRGRMYIQTISFLPMVLPEVIIGISMLIFFSAVNVPLGMFTIFIAHTTFCLPFVFLMVLARLDEFDFSIIEAAHDLGASEKQTLFRVIVPAIMPGILSGFMMAVTMSLEDFVITFFVSGPGSTTLPLYVFSMVRYGISPVINALSFVMILGTMAIAFILRNFLKNIAASK